MKYRALGAYLLAWAALAGSLGSARADTAEPPPATVTSHPKVLGVPAEIVAGQPFTVGFQVRDDAGVPTATHIVFDIPAGLLLAAPPPDCFATFDPGARKFVYDGPTLPGGERHCEVELVAVPDTSNHATFTLSLFTPPATYTDDTAMADIVTPATPPILTVAGIGATRAGIVVLGFLALWLVAVGVTLARTRGAASDPRLLSRRWRAVSVASALVIALGFLVLFAVIAWDDWRSLREFRETRCEILDSTVKHEAVISDRGSSLETGDAYKPVLSLRYSLDGETHRSLGFSTDSKLSYSASDLDRIAAAFHQGRALPCWVDPDDPLRVVVIPGFGGAYVFVLLPLLLLAYAGWLWRTAIPRRD